MFAKRTHLKRGLVKILQLPYLGASCIMLDALTGHFLTRIS